MRTTSLFILFSLFLNTWAIHAQKNAGIFYSTLYAKEGIYKRIGYFGDKADYLFLKDVNGDGMDDAVAVYSSAPGIEPGSVFVALSDGKYFTEPRLALTYKCQLAYVYPLMGDVNGDGKNDLVYVDIYLQRLNVALAKGITFDETTEYRLNTSSGKINESYLADVNGDKNDDLVFYMPDNDFGGKWFACISTGHGFKAAELLLHIKELPSNQQFWGDTNDDGLSDLIAFSAEKKAWQVALSDGKKLQEPIVWLSGFKTANAPVFMIYDVDKDGKDDIVIWKKLHSEELFKIYHEGKRGSLQFGDCSWSVCYSDGKGFSAPEKFISNQLSPSYKGNVPLAEFGLIGSIDGEKSVSMVVSYGKWLGVDFPGRESIANPLLLDTWNVWGQDFIPDGGTYDTGNPEVNLKHIEMIKDAGFTYITMDITNGNAEWVNKRAKKFMESLKDWNSNLKEGGQKLFVNIALGKTREIQGVDAFFNKLNEECKIAWEEYYLPFKDIYYQLDGKPMLIHMITTGQDYVSQYDKWKGDRTYIDKFTNRWMSGDQQGACEGRENYYGWIIPGNNQYHKEMMPLMPQFKNQMTFYPSQGGELYRRLWLRVLKYQPESVWLNSWNDVEYTGIEPAQMVLDQFVSHPKITAWADLYGNRMDDFPYIMTCQYMKLYMEGNLYEGTCFEEENNPDKTIYKATTRGFEKQSGLPVMAPVLLVPEGFTKNFNGSIVKN
jgi:hypothetical protein